METISYEIAMGFALIGVMMAADSLNFQKIVLAQQGGILHWYWLPLFPLFMVYWISGVAETNRSPFDVAEGESEIVAGFHVEYSGIAFGLFFSVSRGVPFFGRLFGDIYIEKKNFTFYFPLTTCILLSLFLTLILWFLARR